ncbi:MAG: hypothetical protein WDZ82_00715 [Candidatus Paceibacterota bacterium]
MISKERLQDLYETQKRSSAEIASVLECSENKVNYWIRKHGIKKRSISDAVYARLNPDGHPFTIRVARDIDDEKLYGLGMGLFWGEGTKRSKHAVRLGNTDPDLIRVFLLFLERICGVDRSKIKFGLQIFSDMNKNKALEVWVDRLGVKKSQFQKVIVTPARGVGNYKQKTKYGVLTVYFNNKYLKEYIDGEIEKLREM